MSTMQAMSTIRGSNDIAVRPPALLFDPSGSLMGLKGGNASGRLSEETWYESRFNPSQTTYLFGGRAPQVLTNAVGAPFLSAPGGDATRSDVEQIDASLLYELVITRMQDERVPVARAEIEARLTKIDANTELQIRKIREKAEIAAKSGSKSTAQLVMGWIGVIAATIGAVVTTLLAVAATVSTGGAAMPLVAVSILSLASALHMLMNMADRTGGGDGFSMGKLVGNLYRKALEAIGVTPEVAADIAKALAGVTAIFVPILLMLEPQLLGGLAGQLAKLVGAPTNTVAYIEMGVGAVSAAIVGVAMACATLGVSSLSSAAALSGQAVSMSRLVGATAQVTAGVGGVAQGGLGIVIACEQKAINDLAADQKFLSLVMATLQTTARSSMEGLSRLFDELATYTRGLDDMIRTVGEGRMEISANAAQRLPV